MTNSMDLVHKLRRHESELRLFRENEKPVSDSEIGRFVPGNETVNSAGRFFKSEQVFQAGHVHGRVPIDLLFETPAPVFSLVGKDAALADLDFNKTVFLDTETTGLAGGTGTVPFLIGLGIFTGDGFRIEQFFMRDYDEERAVLTALQERLGSFRFLVSYNGKGYDLGLLSTRFTLARMVNPAEALPHLDLLHTARRLWKRRLGDCSLGSIERSVLGFVRENDVPGFIIPSLYFEYLRTRNAENLTPVFRHNQWDILALAALAGLSGRIHHHPADHLDHPLDFLSLGRAMENLFRLEEAAACFRKALDHPLEPDEKEEVLLHLGSAWKRLGEWDKAVQVWEYVVENASFSVFPYEELAKYHEHRVGDFQKALSWTQRALDRIGLICELNPDLFMDEDKRDLEIRLKRLKRKLQATSDKQ